MTGTDVIDVTPYIPMVFGMIKRLNMRSRQHYQDLVGEGMIGLVVASHRFNAERRSNHDGQHNAAAMFAAYAGRLIRGHILDWARHVSRSRQRTLVPTFTSIHEIDEDDARPGCDSFFIDRALVSAHRSTDYALLRDAVLALPEDQAEVITGWLNGDTLKEIGARRGVSEGRACQIFTKGRKALQEAMTCANQ